MCSRRAFLAISTLFLSLVLPVAAITTVEVEVVCPVCRTKNKFLDYASWGSYIYSYASKFQLLFWPHTSSSTIYSCKKCHLSLFMWDFKDFPNGKIAETERLLAPVKLSGEYKSYTDIPASEKLQVAEPVYRLLGRDDDFWAHFYRLRGYYLALEKKPAEAAEARRHSLEIVNRMLQDPALVGRRKEFLVLSAAMHHFLKEDDQALADLRTASGLTFSDEKIGSEKSRNFDGYLTALIKEYIPAIEKNSVPDGFGE